MAALMLPPTTIIVSAQAADLRKWSRFCMPRASRRQLAHTRGRPPLRVKCMARGQQSAVKQQKPLNASELQAKFGSEEGLQFRDVGGMTVLELSLSTGTSARLLLHEARVTSYKYRMWHGGLEEILHTDVSDTNTPPTSPHPDHHPNFLITGGIFPSFAHSHPPHLPLFDDNWHVKSVKANPDDYIQGFRRSLVLERYGFENLEVSSPDSDGEKPFVSIGYGSVLSPVNLSPKRTWKGAQVLIPDS